MDRRLGSVCLILFGTSISDLVDEIADFCNP